MKKYAPIWMLCARSSLPWLLVLLVLAGVTETFLFLSAMTPALAVDAVFLNSPIEQVMAVFFILWLVVLTCPGLRSAHYTLDRLPSSHLAQGLCHTGYNLLCCLIFWGFQLALIIGLSLWFSTQSQPPALDSQIPAFGPQSLLLLFYRNDLLHTLLPLHNWTGYLRMTAYLIALSAAAAYPLHYRGKSRTGFLTTVAVMLFLLYTLLSGHGHPMANLSWSAVALIIAACLLLWQNVGNQAEIPEEVDENET